MKAAWTVFAKEWVDALRDRRTLLTVLLSSVAIGPVMIVALSALVASIEERAESRTVLVAGLANAPTLASYLQRMTQQPQEAPPDYEAGLRNRHLGDAVLVVPPDFEAKFAAGQAPVVEIVSASGNTRAAGSVGRLARLLRGFNQEQQTLRLAWRGVAPASLEALQVEERDLADPLARAAQFTGMLPFFVLMAVLYGALNAALDTTAGERERGSLEPLLMNPVPRGALVAGKWGAVALLGMLIAALSSLSFLPAQALMRSDTLQAMFRFGLREAALFVALLAPLAAMLSAVMMAIAIRCKSFKEAQAHNTVVILAVSLLPMFTLFNQEGERPWHLWTPALAQVTLMTRVLKGESFGALELLAPVAVAAAVTVVGLAFVASRLNRAAVR